MDLHAMAKRIAAGPTVHFVPYQSKTTACGLPASTTPQTTYIRSQADCPKCLRSGKT